MGKQLYYGAVYYRKSNPPREDWERDYRQAAADGMNVFRHWFLWGSIETKPGCFALEDYDAQLDLAAKNDMGTIIAEMTNTSPHWLFREHPDCFCVDRQGRRRNQSSYSASCATSGFSHGGVCLDNPKAKALVGRFLETLALRYKGHPGLLGYDIWNECNSPHDVCYCEHTQKKFRLWLEKKYGSLDALNRAWFAYSYACWEDVFAPTSMETTPDCLDWMEFRKENAYEHMRWRAGLIRSIDPDCKITAHGIAGSLNNMAKGLSDDWLAASQVESYGMTWVIARKGSEPWKQWQAVDLLRAGSRDKPFWHAEMQGGPLWLQPQVIGREKEDGRVATAHDVRLWNMTSLAGGASGILYLRWRSLLDGPLFGAFGLYSNDGLPNARSRVASSIARWGNDPRQAALFAARPVQGEIGIVVMPETQSFSELMQQAGTGQFYTRCAWGAYRGFFDNGIQADWAHIDDIDRYDVLYLPYPIHLTKAHADRLIAWVRAGGRLILEGAPGYFGDRGHVSPSQPGLGFAALCGVKESEVEFMPDLGDRIRIDYKGKKLAGGLFLQSYELDGAAQVARYEDGRLAMAEHSYGKGKVLLIGTYPSEGYFRVPDAVGKAFFADALSWAEKEKRADLSDDRAIVRLWRDEEAGRTFAWALNPTGEPISLSANMKVSGTRANVLWGDAAPAFANGAWNLTIGSKDALVFEIVN